MLKNISSNYVKTLILSNLPKNFTEVGKFNCISADTMHTKLDLIYSSHQKMLKLAQDFFVKSKVLYLVTDETFSHHQYSKIIEGTNDHFDSKIYTQIRCHKILSFGITDGKYFLPLFCDFLLGKILPGQQNPSRIAKIMYYKKTKQFN